MPKKMKGLTPLQKRAAEHYVVHGNKTAAYKAAGYAVKTMSPVTVGRTAFRLFEVPAVQEYVKELEEEARSKAVLTRQEALEILSRQARAEIGVFINLDGTIDVRKVKESGPVVKEYKRDEFTSDSGVSVKETLKINGQREAIADLSRMENWNKEKEVKFDSVTLMFDTGVDDDDE